MIAAMFQEIFIGRFKGIANRLTTIECAGRSVGDGRAADHLVCHGIRVNAMEVVIVTAQLCVPQTVPLGHGMGGAKRGTGIGC